MNMQWVCERCFQRVNTDKVDKLKQMLSMCRQRIKEKPNRNTYEHLPWNMNSKCRYGLDCPWLKKLDDECKDLGRQLEPYLKAVATNGDSTLYHTMLSMLRGDFPMEYKRLEEMHMKAMSAKAN
ncbi:MAG: hypothetical protein IKS69_00760 [Erysipelotrichaceae bacterium]|nr:hypothetical protein [Erysipelotrichaceae bacterium]